ncbi:MAG: hypothetical protein HYU78_00940 [Rhodocyclales bacterium]|nr:hypothetical protein [Rhodocyclales bacterium]
MMKSLSLAAVALTVAGCATDVPRNMPLVFGESISVGISVGTPAADGGGEFTLGFKSRDIAVIPVVVYDNAGNPQRLRAENDQKEAVEKSETKRAEGTLTTTQPKKEITSKDAFSVLGVFSTDTSAQSKTVGIGKFFATGTAAQRLADGFSKCLEKNGCSGTSAPTSSGETGTNQNTEK